MSSYISDSDNSDDDRPNKRNPAKPQGKGGNNQQNTGFLDWKPPKYVSYETMQLVSTKRNPSVRPCGFRANGEFRKIKDTCLLARMRNICILKDRRPKMCVCITMYNEDEDLFKLTLSGVIQNFNVMTMDEHLNFKGQDMVVCLVCDGFDKIPNEMKSYMRRHKLFDERILREKGFMKCVDEDEDKWKMKPIKDVLEKNEVNKKRVPPKNICHLFQVSTWNFGLDQDHLTGRRLNFVFAMKHNNDGKINSHKWFFQGISKYLKPDYCLMLDIGTCMQDYALLKLIKYMAINPLCGGCCGEIEVDLDDRRQTQTEFFVRVAQFYEYKLSHSPDKACESAFGFNSVLPGAYCVFRWNAIQNGPMDAFFKLVSKEELREKGQDVEYPSCAEANEYLAEDRVMCLQIYVKRDCGFYLTYIPDCKSVTDAPPDMMTLIKQRRRWQNGAFFAAWRVIFSFIDMTNISCKTKHPLHRSFFQVIFAVYQLCQNIFSLLIVGQYYCTISIFFKSVFASIDFGSPLIQSFFANQFNTIFSYFYAILILFLLIMSLAAPIDKAMFYFRLIGAIFSALTLLMMGGLIAYMAAQPDGFYAPMQHLVKSNDHTSHYEKVGTKLYLNKLQVAGTIMLCVYLLPMIMRPRDCLNMLRGYVMGLIIYLFLLPFFVTIMQVYGFCNLHDLSWGNRPTAAGGTQMITNEQKQQEELKKRYQIFRVNMVVFWFVLNGVYIIVIISTATYELEWINAPGHTSFIEILSLYMAGMVVFKVCSGFLHIARMKWQYNCESKLKVRKVDLLKQVQVMRNLQEREEALMGEEDQNALEEESEEDAANDELLSQSIVVDDAQNRLFQNVQRRRKLEDDQERQAMQITYYDKDDDDDEFDNAEDEEAQDQEYGGGTSYMVSAASRAGSKLSKIVPGSYADGEEGANRRSRNKRGQLKNDQGKVILEQNSAVRNRPDMKFFRGAGTRYRAGMIPAKGEEKSKEAEPKKPEPAKVHNPFTDGPLLPKNE